jgi:ketosteroid isomerase-like protein
MLSWLAKLMLSRNMARLREGDYQPLLRLDADDVRLRFPGTSSWSGDIEGKQDLEGWLQRFTDAGIQIFADEVVVKGFPWNTTLCVRGTDHLDSPQGERVYENRYVIWGRLSWGRLKEYEVYEDTQRASALDDYLESRATAGTGPRSKEQIGSAP